MKEETMKDSPYYPILKNLKEARQIDDETFEKITKQFKEAGTDQEKNKNILIDLLKTL
jgi:hypothetical protein